MPAPDQFSPIGVPVLGNDSLIGFTIDGITLENPLSESGASRTYLGRRQDGQGLRVWIAADHLARDVAFVARFRQEAVQLAALHHVHVETCQGHRTWVAPDGRMLLALVEEASAGVALGDLARREALPVRDVLRLLHQACAGLAAAHRMGIVHGDITPDVMLVTVGGAAKLRSFALGVSGYSPERADRSLIGSPDFMAPEVGRGQQPSSLSDLYSIGAVLVTVLTGDIPFPAATALETIHLHGNAPVPDLAATHPEFALLAPLITRLMAKDPAQRWMDVDDLARDLLVLSNQVAGEVRCRPWSGHRSVPLATRVQTAMSQRQEERLPTPPPKERSTSGGTTTISRNSTEFFRNPELFKPTGLTPANGLPILPPSPDAPPKVRAVRRMGPVMTPVPPPAVLPTEPVLAAPPKTASYLSKLASASAPSGTPPPSISAGSVKRTTPWLVPVILLVVVVVGVVTWVVLNRGERPVPPPVVQVPEVPVTQPASDTLVQRIAAITAVSVRDPASALQQASALRQEQPKADLSRLPVALHLIIYGPEAAAVRITQNGEPVAVSPGSLLCRQRGEPRSLRIEAQGFRAQDIVIPASSADDLTHTVALLDEPHWIMPAFAPTWVKLLPSPDGVVLASDRKVVIISSTDGRELRRLDHASAPMLPENLTWASVLSVAPDKVRFGVTGGLCIEAGATGLTPVSELHRGQSSVLALQMLPLTLRLGEEGIFLIERDGSGFALAADNRERRLWSRSIKSSVVPWFTGQGDRLLVIGDRQIQHFTQEGEEVAPAALPAARTSEPVIGGAAGVFVPTTAGVIRLAAKPQVLPGSSGPVAACAADATVIVAACGRALVAWEVDGENVKPTWSHAEVAESDRRLVQVSLTTDRVIAVDDLGVVRMFARADGRALRTVRTGAALLAAPVLVGERVIAVLAPGVVCAY
jgi:serine/threonine protein kinase